MDQILDWIYCCDSDPNNNYNYHVVCFKNFAKKKLQYVMRTLDKLYYQFMTCKNNKHRQAHQKNITKNVNKLF